MVEFPSIAQLPRILREEGIPAKVAERAFGKLKRNGGGNVVRKGYLKIGETTAVEYLGPEEKLSGKIHITGPGVSLYKTVGEFGRIAERLGIPPAAVIEAFGHLTQGAPMSEEEDARSLVFGQKRAKLGHVTSADGGPITGFAHGVRQGSLLLVDTRTNAPIWGAFDAGDGRLRSYTSNRSLTLKSVFDKSKTLRIPTRAVVTAFGYLMERGERSRLLSELSGTQWRRGNRR